MSKCEMLVIIKKILIFIILIFIFDLVFGLIYSKYFYLQSDSRFAKSNYAFKNCYDEIIILGDSRAEHHYNTKNISDSLNLSSFNFGSDGQSLFYHNAILKALLLRYKPKIIILDLNPKDLFYNEKSYDRLSYLFPYDTKIVDDFVRLDSFFKVYFKKINFYKYNGTFLITLKSYFSPKKYYQGFNPLYGNIDDKSKVEMNKSIRNEIIDSNKIKSFNEIIDCCSKNNIELFIFVSPYYNLFYNDDTFKIDHFLNKRLLNNIKYFDFSSSNLFLKNDTIFKDNSHLNSKGADYYTDMVISLIKSENLTNQ